MTRFSSPLIITIEKYSVSFSVPLSDAAALVYESHTDYTGRAVDGLRLLRLHIRRRRPPDGHAHLYLAP